MTHWLCFVSNTNDVCFAKFIEMFVQLRNITEELQIGIKHNHSVDGLRHYAMHRYRQEEQCVVVICTLFVAEMFLHWLNDEVKFLCQLHNIQQHKLQHIIMLVN